MLGSLNWAGKRRLDVHLSGFDEAMFSAQVLLYDCWNNNSDWSCEDLVNRLGG